MLNCITDKEAYLKEEQEANQRQTRAMFVWESARELHLEILDFGLMAKNLEQSSNVLARLMLDPTTVQSLPVHGAQSDSPILVCANLMESATH